MWAKNGAGKSTMLKIIAGIQKPTSGNVAIPNDTTIGYLPQHMTISDSATVIEEVRTAFSHIREMHERLDRMSEELASRTDYESDSYQELIEAMTTLTDRIAMEESDNCEAEMEKTLLGLGFVRDDFKRPTSEFSGGWRMRIELAKLLLTRPDVLLLDEPTNHLDIESIQWLENFLVTKANAVVLVSHDRAFIDNVTNRTIEISLRKDIRLLGQLFQICHSAPGTSRTTDESFSESAEDDQGNRRLYRAISLQSH